MVDFIPTSDIAVAARELKIRHGGVGGNLSVALSRLGISAVLVGCVGRDVFGEEITRELEAEGVDTSFVKVDPNTHTGVMVILVVPGGGRSIVGFRGANASVSLSDDEVNKLLSDVDHLHLSGYMALNNDRGELLLRLARKAKSMGITVSVDLEGVSTQRRELARQLKGLVDYVMLNRDEITSLTNTRDVEASARELLRMIKPRAVFVKLGKDGSLVVEADKIKHVEPLRVDAVDSTGAGDAFNAGVIYSLLEGKRASEAALIGNAMGAYACTGIGARHFPRGISELAELFPQLRKHI